MNNKEIGVGNKKIGEETKISLSLGTAVWIIVGTISIFSTLFTLGYLDLKKDVKNYKEQSDKDKLEYFQKVDSKFNEEVDKMRDKNDDVLKDIGDIKGNIKVILDRTSGVRTEIVSTTQNPPPIPTKVK